MSDDIKKPLTALSVRNLSKGWLADVSPNAGLRLIVSPRGVKSWCYRYRPRGASDSLRQITFGHYPAMSLSEARDRLHELKRIRDAGIDPREQIKKSATLKATERLSKQDRFTVRDLVDLYLKVHIKRNRRLKGQREVERLFFKDVIPTMGHMEAIEVKRSLVYDLKEKIITRGAPVVAGSVVRELRLAFEVAIDAGKLPDDFQNPCDRVKAPSNKKRERYLTDGELEILFRWLPESELSVNARNALLLCLLTGCRSGEVVAMRWNDIDLVRGTWRLMRNKTNVERYVQLSTQAMAFLGSIPRRCDIYVFPSNLRDGEHVLQKTVSYNIWQRVKSSELRGWNIHDLRRTTRTGVSRLGCSFEVGEAILGHSKAGVHGVYNLHKYEDECRNWLQIWADHLSTFGLLAVLNI